MSDRGRKRWSGRVFTERLLRHWPWLIPGLAGCALAGFFAGYALGPCTATVELAESSLELRTSAFGVRTLDLLPRLGALARSALLARRVAEKLGRPPDWGPNSPAPLAAVRADAGLLALTVRGRTPGQTARLANTYGAELAALAAELEASRRRQTVRDLESRLAALDADLARLGREQAEFERGWSGPDLAAEPGAWRQHLGELEQKAQELRARLAACELQIQTLTKELASLAPALVAAREALAQALLRYTEAHPKVKELQATVAALEAQAAAPAGSETPALAPQSAAAAGLFARLSETKGQQTALLAELETLLVQKHQWQAHLAALPEARAKHLRLASQLQALKEQRFALARALQAAQGPAGVEAARVRVLQAVGPAAVSRQPKVQAGLWTGSASALAGLALAILWAAAPASRRRIRSAAELVDATGLPLLATLDEAVTQTDEQRQQWAFRLFTRLRGRLARSRDQALVCGLVSASGQEDRATCLRLLAEAATKLGYHVAAVSATDAATEAAAPLAEVAEPGPNPPELECLPARPAAAGDVAARRPQARREALLPARRVWQPDYRNQWRQAIDHWQQRERLAVFVELPPASTPEAVLLAAPLPNLLWLGTDGCASVAETRAGCELLVRAGANLVGCVFQRAGRIGRRAARWALLALGSVALGLTAGRAPAQQTNPPAPPAAAAPAEGSLSAPEGLADWQKRLTLGPGDTFDVSLYEQPDSIRNGLSIGPDGRINYLEARDVMAAGLTVDELRAVLEERLAKFHRAPRVIINPTAYVSKKYYILGHVNQKGIFPLDRPVSIIEAIARARGFVTTAQAGNTWIQADFGRSFLIRRGPDGGFARVPVDFEALFLQGDLGQNLALEPDDYLFFPPLDLQEVYVLGEVRGPGVLPWSPDLTALGAIAARGGFTPQAFKSRVLIVRGSLARPQTLVLDVADIWKAKGLDLPLRPRDIVYVHRRPWAKAQELLESAVLTFARSVAMGYANQHIGPFITEPWIK